MPLSCDHSVSATAAQANLPPPSPQEQDHAQKLKHNLAQRPQPVAFVDYMQACLTDKDYGYYTHWQHQIQRDFVTAPEISPLFGQVIAEQILAFLHTYPDGQILEFGPGRGSLCVTIVNTLVQWVEDGSLPKLPTYYCLEVSASLQQIQRDQIHQHPSLQSWTDHIQWLNHLPTLTQPTFVIANEILDAFAVQRFQWQDQQWHEWAVQCQASGNDVTLTPDLIPPRHIDTDDALHWLTQHCPHPAEGYTTEFNPSIKPWLNALKTALPNALILLIDYGYGASEYYRAERFNGTLRVQSQHHAHEDVWRLPGCEDITSHVDFSWLHQVVNDLDFTPIAYQTQAQFLMQGGLLNWINTDNDTQALAEQSRQIQLLTSPNHMGEMFKIYTFSQALAFEPPACVGRHLWHQL